MASLLADIELTSAHTLTGSFADITGMTATVAIAGTGSVVLLLMSLNGDASDNNDETGEYRFTVDGSPVGAVITSFKDGTDEGNSCTLAFAVTGLSAAAHTFAVQGANVQGTVPMDTTRVRLFQVVEITSGASIVVDISSTSADTSTGAFTVIDAMTSTITAVAGRAYLMLASNQADLSVAANLSADHSFAVGGVRVGPIMHNHGDAVDEGDGVTLAFVATGVSGSTSFALQWITRDGATSTDTTRPRILQVIELEASIFNLLASITSVSADTADPVAGTFTVINDLTTSPTVDSTDSVLLKLFGMQADPDGSQISIAYRLRTDASQVGAEVTQFGNADDRVPGQALVHAETGLSAASHTFDAEWAQIIIPGADAIANTSLNRALQVLELLAPPPIIVCTSGVWSVTVGFVPCDDLRIEIDGPAADDVKVSATLEFEE